MNQLILLFLLLLSILCYGETQSPSEQDYPISENNNGNFEPSIAVVLLILIIMFILTILLVSYAFCCHSTRSVRIRNNQQNSDGLIIPVSRSSGIDKIVIESLPFFKFSVLKGLRGGLECVVCLCKFEDVEILRLLPKCKHAFHINCVDQWLENHSSCPLCRQRISVDDLTYSNSMRFLSSQSDVRQDSNMELFVQREDNRHGSSRFSIGSSFRKFKKGVAKENQFPIREKSDVVEENEKFLHKFNHKIIMSNAVLKSRWSNLSSSDLLFLNSEMLGDVSSNRFPPLDSQTHENSITSNPTRNLQPKEKRSMSERVVHSRFNEVNMGNSSVGESSVPENAAQEDRLKRLWLPIARKTVQWYANRDKRLNYTRQSLNV